MQIKFSRFYSYLLPKFFLKADKNVPLAETRNDYCRIWKRKNRELRSRWVFHFLKFLSIFQKKGTATLKEQGSMYSEGKKIPSELFMIFFQRIASFWSFLTQISYRVRRRFAKRFLYASSRVRSKKNRTKWGLYSTCLVMVKTRIFVFPFTADNTKRELGKIFFFVIHFNRKEKLNIYDKLYHISTK